MHTYGLLNLNRNGLEENSVFLHVRAARPPERDLTLRRPLLIRFTRELWDIIICKNTQSHRLGDAYVVLDPDLLLADLAIPIMTHRRRIDIAYRLVNMWYHPLQGVANSRVDLDDIVR